MFSLFSRAWRNPWMTLSVVLILLGAVAREGLVIGFGVMGLLVAGISWLWNKVSLEEVSYERHLSQQRAFIGEEISMTVTLTNKKPVPLSRVEVNDQVSDAIAIADADITPGLSPNTQELRHSTSMAWYERIRWDYHVTCSKRGLHRIGPAQMESGDLFGFYISEKSVPDEEYLLVYPRVVPLTELGLPAARPLGEVGGGLRIFQDPSRPSGLRDYQQGDPMKIVDWKASARMQKLQVRTFDPSSAITLIMVVVVETTARYRQGYSPPNLELVITAAASVASYAAEQQYSLGLFSNGTPILSDRPMKIAPSRSPEQLTIILEALATVQPLEMMGHMADQLAEHTRRFPIGATLVVITAFLPPELVEAIRNLKAQGHRMVVLYVGDGSSPELPEGVLGHELQEYFTTNGAGP